MDKREELSQLITELEKWKQNRARASARRTYGSPLSSEPLEKAIIYLSEYREIIRH